MLYSFHIHVLCLVLCGQHSVLAPALDWRWEGEQVQEAWPLLPTHVAVMRARVALCTDWETLPLQECLHPGPGHGPHCSRSCLSPCWGSPLPGEGRMDFEHQNFVLVSCVICWAKESNSQGAEPSALGVLVGAHTRSPFY